MNKKLRIIVPIYKFGKSGGNRVLSKLADGWIEQGHIVDFVTSMNPQELYYPTRANIIALNEIDKVKSSANKRRSSFKSIIETVKYIHENHNKYDVAFANFWLTSITVLLSRIRVKIYYIQAYEPEFYSWKDLRQIIQKIISYLTYFFPITKIVNANIYKNYKNLKSDHVIYPGLDLNVYRPSNQSKKRNNDQFVVGCIGRNEEWKGSGDVTEAVRILHRKGYNIAYKVAFNPVSYDKYELVKPDGDTNLAEFYRGLDVLVAPGHIQLGAVHYPVIEAMACKTTVITTGYYPANCDNAYIVPVKSPDMIADTIIEIMKNSEQARVKVENAYKDIQQFEWGIVSQKFIDLFQIREIKDDEK